MKIYLTLLVLLTSTWASAQQSDTIKTKDLSEVVISAYKDKSIVSSSINITPLKMDSVNKYGTYSLSEVLAKTPGVSMLSTGLAIAKPVIRGLYGNRVLVLMNGLKFDNQQWQEEHGLGLSALGLSKVELIKGPIGILYGTEAIGGVVNLIDEERARPYSKEADFSVNFNTNTMGGLVQAGYKASKAHTWWRLRLGADNHADYTDGNNNRVLNSRFDGYYMKASFGFERKNWVSNNNYSGSFNRYGFIFNDIYTFITADKRWSRRLDENPAHLVLLNLISSENKISFNDKSKLSINFGVQSNKRMENEGGGAISLNMHLLTIQNLSKYECSLTPKNKLILSNLISFENNTNFGARKIVPNANMQESNLSAYLESTLGEHLVLENGAGIGEKSIQTFLTLSVNDPSKEIQPFKKFSPYYNAFTGLTYFPSQHFNIKANLATGVRVANLAELSSNGLHEGVFTYEIGDPKLKNEQIISLNMYANYSSKYVDFSVSPFYNYFLNYIYLAPTAEDWFGFPVYRYKQQNATQYGTELSGLVRPIKGMEIKLSYAGMISKTKDGLFTPFIPAQKITPTVTYTFHNKQHIPVQVFTNMECNFAQNNIAPNEIATPNYQLWNAGISANIKKNDKNYTFALAVNNILNTAYYDHLSRFKYFGLLNIGRNVMINMKVKL